MYGIGIACMLDDDGHYCHCCVCVFLLYTYTSAAILIDIINDTSDVDNSSSLRVVVAIVTVSHCLIAVIVAVIRVGDL